MSDILPVSFTFVGTTVESGPAIKYLLNTESRMLRYAQAAGLNQLVLDTLNRMEHVGIQIRHYVAGYRKTLHRTLREVRWFIHDYPDMATTLIPAVINVIQDAFIKNEWYELMPRFEKAVIKIEKLLNRLS